MPRLLLERLRGSVRRLLLGALLLLAPATALPASPQVDGIDHAARDLATGLSHHQAGRYSEAILALDAARARPGPLQGLSAWAAATTWLAAGAPQDAADTCADAVQRLPDDPFAERCRQLLPFALVRAQQLEAALAAADDWDADHPKEPIGEAIALAVAVQRAQIDPPDAIPSLQSLATRFTAPLTERIARLALDDLLARGHPEATVPTDLPDRLAIARSLKHTGQRDRAWNAFTDLIADAADAPGLLQTLEEEAEDFAWSTRRFDALITQLRRAEGRRASEDWQLFRALDRAGRSEEALRVGLRGLGEHPSWRHRHEIVARAALFAKDPRQARDLFDHGASPRSRDGRRRRFYAAFSAVLAGDTADAAARLDTILQRDPDHAPGARYWRARLLQEIDPAAAQADRAWLQTHATDHWYAVLGRTPTMAPRHGRWPTGPVSRPPPATPDLAAPLPPAAPSWYRPARLAPHLPPIHAHPLPWPGPAPLPVAARDAATRLAPTTPDPLAAVALADAGLPSLAGAHLTRWYRDGGRAGPKAWSELSPADQLALILHTQAHHLAVRHASRLTRALSLPAESVAHLELPLAHADAVWRHSQRYDVDPYLVLAIMRTESLYDPDAVSYAGARGPMQIMPRTGHLLADRLDEPSFTVADLHDPDVAIGYGVRYLSLLLDRFDGVFPLAVASYNGGPHNVSAWMQALDADLPMDVFVEHIPFGQTRRYVRKVTAVYDAYVRAWEGPGAGVAVPPRLRGDAPEIVDF